MHSGDYYMFESDSGEEDESFQEEQKPRRQTAFQVTCFVLTLFYVWWGGFYRDNCVKCLCLNCFPQLAYHAWVTSAKKLWKTVSRGRKSREPKQRSNKPLRLQVKHWHSKHMKLTVIHTQRNKQSAAHFIILHWNIKLSISLCGYQMTQRRVKLFLMGKKWRRCKRKEMMWVSQSWVSNKCEIIIRFF